MDISPHWAFNASMRPDPLIPKHGGFRKLKSFQIAQLCYDVTVRFCDRYIEKRSRTHDQMVQAARSGVQNIAEGSSASATSKKTELKFTNVARASLEELRLDYEDFLRHRGLPLWPESDPRCRSLVARRCATADAVGRAGSSVFLEVALDFMDPMDNILDAADARLGPSGRGAAALSGYSGHKTAPVTS